MTRVAILQSNYIPWKGYFDLIASVDIFVLYDDMQYTKRDWRNRNKIMTPVGSRWLTVPVEVKGKYFQKINETLVSDTDWASKHWNIIAQNYRKAPHFGAISTWLKPIYQKIETPYLSEVNLLLIEAICEYLGIRTKIVKSSDFTLAEGKTDRLVDLAMQLEATAYYSGPAAKGYLDTEVFERAGIKVTWFDYSGYKEYPQLSENFDHYVTVLDLLFNTGSSAQDYLRFVK